jgi:hypothetical protein
VLELLLFRDGEGFICDLLIVCSARSVAVVFSLSSPASFRDSFSHSSRFSSLVPPEDFDALCDKEQTDLVIFASPGRLESPPLHEFSDTCGFI